MPGSAPISILLIARDEAVRLDALLPRLAFARDVVVVVDTASRDDTPGVAARHGARVFERALDGFGPQRQFALEHCREPWVLWIDADEALTAADAERVVALTAASDAHGFRLKRRSWFLGRPIRYCGWQNERVLRLFRRDRARFDDAPIHERVHVEGAIRNAEVTLEHHSYETFGDARRKLLAYASANARRVASASILDVALRPPLRFFRMYVLQLGFLDGARGLLVCALGATQVLLKYAQAWADRHGASR